MGDFLKECDFVQNNLWRNNYVKMDILSVLAY